MKSIRDIQAPLAWGYQWADGAVINIAEHTRPRKLGRRTYTSAMQAVGARVIRVRVIKDSDYKRLIRAASRRSE